MRVNSDENRVRTLIVDHHPVGRQRLSSALAAFDDISVVGAAGSGDEAVRLCALHHPDVVLIDMRMPDTDGSAATLRIKELHPATQVVVLTSFSEPQFPGVAASTGALAHLLRDFEIDELAHAVRNASRHKSTLGTRGLGTLNQPECGRGELMEELTERQREVLAMVVRGYSNQEIARRLRISISTVRYHVGEILGRLGAANRTQATAIAIQHNLLERSS